MRYFLPFTKCESLILKGIEFPFDFQDSFQNCKEPIHIMVPPSLNIKLSEIVTTIWSVLGKYLGKELGRMLAKEPSITVVSIPQAFPTKDWFQA